MADEEQKLDVAEAVAALNKGLRLRLEHIIMRKQEAIRLPDPRARSPVADLRP